MPRLRRLDARRRRLSLLRQRPELGAPSSVRQRIDSLDSSIRNRRRRSYEGVEDH
jgi:hypothetical protein